LALSREQAARLEQELAAERQRLQAVYRDMERRRGGVKEF
jgi:hypothetical protein